MLVFAVLVLIVKAPHIDYAFRLGHLTKEAGQLQVGDSRQRVIDLLGTPDDEYTRRPDQVYPLRTHMRYVLKRPDKRLSPPWTVLVILSPSGKVQEVRIRNGDHETVSIVP